MCAHVRKHTMAGIERDVKKGWKTWNVKEDPERKRDRGGGTQSSEAKRRHSRRKEDFHRFPIIPLIGCPIKFRGIVSTPPPNSSGRVRINSRLAISSTTVSLSSPLFFFDCSLVHHANSRYPLASTPRGQRLLLFPFSLHRERGYEKGMGGEKKKRKKKKLK